MWLSHLLQQGQWQSRWMHILRFEWQTVSNCAVYPIEWQSPKEHIHIHCRIGHPHDLRVATCRQVVAIGTIATFRESSVVHATVSALTSYTSFIRAFHPFFQSIPPYDCPSLSKKSPRMLSALLPPWVQPWVLILQSGIQPIYVAISIKVWTIPEVASGCKSVSIGITPCQMSQPQ